MSNTVCSQSMHNIYREDALHTENSSGCCILDRSSNVLCNSRVQGSRNAVFSPYLQAEELKSIPLGRRKLLCSKKEPSLSVSEEKGTQHQPSTRKQRSRYTRECSRIKNICKCKSGQRRPPGFCCELFFWKLCRAQVKCGAHWCSHLLHEYGLSSRSSVSVLCLAQSDTHCQGGNPQWHHTGS